MRSARERVPRDGRRARKVTLAKKEAGENIEEPSRCIANNHATAGAIPAPRNLDATPRTPRMRFALTRRHCAPDVVNRYRAC